MPGSGKQSIRDTINEFGFPVIIMGDEVRAEAKRRNLNPTSENLGTLMLQLRVENGLAAIAKLCISKIIALNFPFIAVDGIRSLHEVLEFKRNFTDFYMIAIHSSPKTRFNRLKNRGRSDDPKNWESFIIRDQRELSIGISEVIAKADYMIINEKTKAWLRTESRRIMCEIMGKKKNGRS
jgi:dephospho-CoA kinase